ncbi:Uncharacterized protein FWK35_00005794 [Aphis craccivora]|uniref:Uncharacterized protein n=1 Tax=Aphis craccivora TaxID=307492 RepID=A0A6G0Z024_APHCR|nr:Uncharacterized protein FWK35_00005794 [Aphis craccivora]
MIHQLRFEYTLVLNAYKLTLYLKPEGISETRALEIYNNNLTMQMQHIQYIQCVTTCNWNKGPFLPGNIEEDHKILFFPNSYYHVQEDVLIDIFIQIINNSNWHFAYIKQMSISRNFFKSPFFNITHKNIHYNDLHINDILILKRVMNRSRNNASISNFGVISDGKVNIIEIKSKHFPTVFKKIEKNKKKSDGNTGIFRQNHDDKKFLYDQKNFYKPIDTRFLMNH